MSEPVQSHSVDALLDRALAALADGDSATAKRLAVEVLAVDSANTDAEDLLSLPDAGGEMRRLTIIFVDLVDSTALSTEIDIETYRALIGRYHNEVNRVIAQYGGHIESTKGDGLLGYFGHPHAHEDDVTRTVHAGLDIIRAVVALSKLVRRRFDFSVAARVGIHRGIVYLDTTNSDVYGLPANLAARVCTLAEPNTVAVSYAIEPLVRDLFELQARPPAFVKGVKEPIRHSLVISERDSPRTAFGPLIGRDPERQHIEQSWAQAVEGDLTIPGVMFIGDAGIGKSRLAWCAVDLAEQSRATVLQLVGSPFHTDVGLRPVRRLLERRCGIDRNSDPVQRLGQLENEIRTLSLDPDTVIPALAPLLRVDVHGRYRPVHADGRKLSELIADAIHQYLLACIGDAPTLILVEDMHQFDPSSIEVVNALLNDDLGGHTLVVATTREYATRADLPQTHAFQLNPLTGTEADELIVALHPNATHDEQVAVRQRCDGIPLYIEEVVAKLKVQSTNDDAGPSDVPDSLYGALFTRLRASTTATPVIEAAALLGSRIDRNLLLSIIDQPEVTVDTVISQLVEARVLEPLEAGNWRFRHELLREVAAELSPPTVRRRLHHRIADALAAAAPGGNPDWPLIARHYERAEQYAQASSAFSAASADARQRGALEEARSHLSNAIAQVGCSPEGPDRDRSEIALRLRRGFLIYAAEGASSPAAAAEFERCLQLRGADSATGELLTGDELFATFCALYGYYAMRADLDRVEQLLQSVRANLLDTRQWFRPFNEAAFGMLAWYRGDFHGARQKLQSSAQARSEVGARELAAIWFMPNEATASIYTHLALAHYMQGDLTGAEAELERTENRCTTTDFPQGAFSLAYARQMECVIRIDAGQLDAAAQAAGDLTRLGEQHGFDSWTMVGTAQSICVGAIAAVEAGATQADLAPYITAITGFVDLWRALGVISLITFYDAILARLLMASGQAADVRERISTALTLADQTGMHFYDAELLRLQALSADDATQRTSGLRDAIELAREQGAHVLELRSALNHFDETGGAHRQLLQAATDSFSTESTWPELQRARAILG